MTDEAPPRLKSNGETPDELVRALRALGKDRDGARVARVAERVTASVVASGAAAGLLSGAKLVTAGVIISLGALGYYAFSSEPAAPSARQQHAPAPAPAPIETTAPIAAPALRVEPQLNGAKVDPLDAARPSQGRSSASRAPTAKNVASVAASKPSETTSLAPAETVAQDEPKPEPSEVAPPAQPAAPTVELAVEPSEEALLLQARKLATKQPEGALRLLEQHGKRFARGMLVPEREVLTIEVLRRLGREREAQQRLEQFEARYPQSIHLRRLKRQSAASDDN